MVILFVWLFISPDNIKHSSLLSTRLRNLSCNCDCDHSHKTLIAQLFFLLRGELVGRALICTANCTKHCQCLKGTSYCNQRATEEPEIRNLRSRSTGDRSPTNIFFVREFWRSKCLWSVLSPVFPCFLDFLVFFLLRFPSLLWVSSNLPKNLEGSAQRTYRWGSVLLLTKKARKGGSRLRLISASLIASDLRSGSMVREVPDSSKKRVVEGPWLLPRSWVNW